MEECGSEEIIRKGPWKLEEDEVLLNHVKRYGPRDWSSIRSKGLLQRTGKSCRLRWVNKLRPNLKNGCKFSAEEESVVIELQAQFGNKWAKIATYLPGRTDNDVKNFWSSRQKKLARMLQSSTTTSKLHKSTKKGRTVDHNVPSILEAPKLSSASASEAESSSRPFSCTSPSCCTENSKVIDIYSFQDFYNPKLLGFQTNVLQPELDHIETKPFVEPNRQIYFPSPLQSLPPESTFLYQNQEFLSRLHDPNFDVFTDPMDDVSQLGNEVELPIGPQLFEPVGSFPCHCDALREKLEYPMTPESFFNEFPADMFDHIDPFTSSAGQ